MNNSLKKLKRRKMKSMPNVFDWGRREMLFSKNKTNRSHFCFKNEKESIKKYHFLYWIQKNFSCLSFFSKKGPIWRIQIIKFWTLFLFLKIFSSSKISFGANVIIKKSWHVNSIKLELKKLQGNQKVWID